MTVRIEARQGASRSAPADPLRRALALLDVRPSRVAAAVALGVLGLGCAVALAGVAAWLIARASQMPPVLMLSVATVAVRAFGIGRGIFRYLERLVSHDVALRGMTALRTTLYERLARGHPAATLGLRSGDLLARAGRDVDDVGDVVVRALLPAAVAAVLGIGTAAVMALFLPAAGATLAVCLVLAGVVAPALAARAAATTERAAHHARTEVTAAALTLLDDAGPLAVQGRVGAELAALRGADADLAAATDRGARAAAVAAALGSVAVGAAVLGALLVGVPAVGAGTLTPVELAVVVLTPLAAFEATSVLPAAAVQLARSRAAAARLMELLDDAGPAADGGSRPSAEPPVAAARLEARDLACGWPDAAPAVRGVDLDVAPGRSVAVVGPSGTGKTTLLLTLAGLLPPASGAVRLGGADLRELSRADVAAQVVVTTEDAHVFGTTVLENLRVARGDVTVDEADAALRRAGLGDWLDGLPLGTATLLGTGAQDVSGGERRRLLLARALVSHAPLLLVDEPAEHLDPATADALVRDLLAGAGPDRGVVVVTHRLSTLDAADEVVVLGDGTVRARGRHADLLATLPDYREAYRREREDAP